MTLALGSRAGKGGVVPFSGVPRPFGWIILPGNMLMMNSLRGRGVGCPAARSGLLGLLGLLLAGLAAGCAHTPAAGELGGPIETFPTPLPPIFLNGPMGLLLTNEAGFRAHVVLEGAGTSWPGTTSGGELLCRGSKLLFAPAPGKARKKQGRPEDNAFIWDVAEHRGWVLNDPLQGYAPMSSSRAFTNLITQPVPGTVPGKKISGHRCVPDEATVMADDGVPATFIVWRAPDLRGLPLRIESRASGTPMVLTLSKVQLEAVPADLFQPPNGFTKYESAENMMSELFLRTHNLSRKQIAPLDATEPGAVNPAAAPARSY